jgi:phosphoribosylamine--glycine ligase
MKPDSSVFMVVGSGGREHALAWSVARSESVLRVYVAPGNGGTERERKCQNVAIDETDVDELLAFAAAQGVGLTIVGPEVPLGLGIVDRFRAAGLPIFGPTQAAARLETSKVWARQFMARHGIPQPESTVATDAAAARGAVEALDGQCVVKADGLAGGKGVFVCDSVAEGHAAIEAIMVARRFGAAGDHVLVEERVTGQELSVMVVSDGQSSFRVLPAQDHKALLDGNQGPNTGGMGAYVPAPFATAELLAEVRERILDPTIAGMAAEETPFTGCLYCGLMLTRRGPLVLEFNVRFGDPETQVQLPLLDSDLARVMRLAAEGRLEDVQVGWNMGRAAVCVVLASQGYPDKPLTGFVVHGLEEAEAMDGIRIFHAGTRRAEGEVVSSGGRVLDVVCVQDTLAEAVRGAYAAIGDAGVRFRGMHYRRDIGAQALVSD